jgi:hypothetical protein
MEEIAVTKDERKAHSAAASAEKLHNRPGTLRPSPSIDPSKASSVRPLATTNPAHVDTIASKTPRAVRSSSGSKRARRNSNVQTGSCATKPKAARIASSDGKLRVSDVAPYQVVGVDESSSVSRLHYVPQHQLKLLFNQNLAEYISTATYPNTSIAMPETDKFYTCVCIEAGLVQHSYNAMSYIDFILYHFEPGDLLQTCADRRSIFADKIRADDRFVTYGVPPRYTSCFVEIPCDVTFKCATLRTNIIDYIVQHTNVKNFDVVAFTVTATVQYGDILCEDHFMALNGGDFDSMDASMQWLITDPLDLIDTFRDVLQGLRSSWMDGNERLSTHSTNFSVNGVSPPTLCTRPIDLVTLNTMLTSACNVQMPELTDWTRKLTRSPNNLRFPMDTCFPSNVGMLHDPQINVRLPGMNEEYCDISTSPAAFLIIAVTNADTISAVTARVVGMLTFRTRLQESGVHVMGMLDPERRQGLVDPSQSHTAGRQQIIEPAVVVSSLSFSGTFKFGTTRDSFVCVSSRDPKKQIPFNRALRNRRGPVLQFVFVPDDSGGT